MDEDDEKEHAGLDDEPPIEGCAPVVDADVELEAALTRSYEDALAAGVTSEPTALACAAIVVATRHVLRNGAATPSTLFQHAVLVHTVVLHTTSLRHRNFASLEVQQWAELAAAVPAVQEAAHLWDPMLQRLARLMELKQDVPVIDVAEGRLFRLVCCLLSAGAAARDLLQLQPEQADEAASQDNVQHTALTTWLMSALELPAATLETPIDAAVAPQAEAALLVLQARAAEVSQAAEAPITISPLSSNPTLQRWLPDVVDALREFEVPPQQALAIDPPQWSRAGFNAEFQGEGGDADRFASISSRLVDKDYVERVVNRVSACPST